MAGQAGGLHMVAEFFGGSEARSLLLRGPAGSGKTTLCTAACKILRGSAPPLVIGSRVSSPGRLPRIDGSTTIATSSSESRSLPENGHALRFPRLDNLVYRMQEGEDVGLPDDPRSPVEIDQGEVVLEEDDDVPSFENIKSHVRAHWPARTTVVVDSIDGLVETAGIDGSRIVKAFQGDLVEANLAHVIFVAETSGTSKLDYVTDGVMSLSTEDVCGRRLRILSLEKLRSVEIRQPRTNFTLYAGAFRAFGPWQDPMHVDSRPWTRVPDPDPGSVSWGYRTLDAVFGGLRHGTLAAVEFGPTVSPIFEHLVVSGLVANFASAERGVVFIPARRGSSAVWRGLMEPLTGRESWDRRVLMPIPDESIDGIDPHINLKWENLEFRLSGSKTPFASVIAFDTMESLYGDGALDRAYSHMAGVNRAGGVFVALTNPLLKSNRRLAGIARVHIRFECVNGCIVAFGEKPYTELHHVGVADNGSDRNLVLTPIV